MEQTAVEWLVNVVKPFVEIPEEIIKRALEMEEQQMCNHISFGANLKKSMEEIVYEDIKKNLEELVKQGKLKDYRNYKSE
jgi:hypothetical protein